MSTPAARLKQALEKKGMTQKELADIVGSKQSVINNYLSEHRGSKRPDIYLYLRMIKALDTTPNWIFLGVK